MQKELIRETQAQAQFPKWVIRAVSAMSASRLLYPPKPDIRLLGRHGRNVPSIPDTCPFRKFHPGWIREAEGICRTVWPTALSSRDQWCDEAQASMPLGGCDLVAHPFADYFAFAQLGCELIKTRSYDDRSGA